MENKLGKQLQSQGKAVTSFAVLTFREVEELPKSPRLTTKPKLSSKIDNQNKQVFSSDMEEKSGFLPDLLRWNKGSFEVEEGWEKVMVSCCRFRNNSKLWLNNKCHCVRKINWTKNSTAKECRSLFFLYSHLGR